MPGTITIKGGINSVIQNDENDNLILTTNNASKQIYFQGTSSADAPLYVNEHGNTIFQDNGSGQSVSLTVSQSSYGGYAVTFASASTQLNAIKLLQDTSGSGAGHKRALITLSGSSTTNVGFNLDTPYVDRLSRGYGEMFVTTGAGGLAVTHYGVNPYSHSFFIGNHLTYLGAYETATFEVQDDSYGSWTNPSIIHRLPTQMTNITASGNISASGTIYASDFQSGIGGSGIDFNDDLDVDGHITASGNISASGTSHTFGGDVTIGDDLTLPADGIINFGSDVAQIKGSTGALDLIHSQTNF